MSNALNGKKMENSRNRINVKLVTNENDYLESTSKPSYMLQKILDNDVVVIKKVKLH